MNTESFNNRTTDMLVPVSRRTAVKIIAGTSLALAISPSLAFAEEEEPSEATAEDPQSLMNSWRYRNGELIDTTPAENGIAPLSSTTPYGQDANGNWCNKYGEPIPGALLRGIDVSEHNGTIDWATVASKGNVDFAIIRCGYGTDIASQDDKQFLNNVRGCISNGIPFGVYLYSYASNTSRAQSEANHVLRTLGEAGVGPNDLSYPVYYDLEQETDGKPSGLSSSGSPVYLSNSDLANIASAFCSVIQSAGYTVGVYANTNWWTNYLTGSVFGSWSRWVAQYNRTCTYAGTYDIWQAGSDGSVSGINGRVDINFDFVGFAGDDAWSRIYGQHHLDTMALISKTGWSSSSSVVIATEGTYWDALTASALAGIYNCPILLTTSNALSAQTKSEIARLGAKTAYVVGGPIAIASSVDSQIKAAGCTKVERVYGQDQQGTARAIAERVVASSGKSDLCIIATSYTFQDSLSISPYAFWAKAPIYLCESGSNELSTDTLNAIKSAGFKKALIVGGPIAVSSNVEPQLKRYGVTSIERQYGQTEYETSTAIAKWEIARGMTANYMALATGVTYYDALAGGALCGKNGSVLVIASDYNRSSISDFIRPQKSSIETGYVFGGPIAVSDATWRELTRA